MATLKKVSVRAERYWTIHILPPDAIRTTAPRPFLDVDNIIAELAHAISNTLFKTIHNAVNQYDSKDAYGDPKQGQ
mgnify:CR=1 FL=1